MPKFENPFSADKIKKYATYGALAMGASACAPGSGEKSGVTSAYDANMEQSAENSPEAIQSRLLGDLQIGLNDFGGGDVILVAMSSGLSIDGAEESARTELNTMKSQISGVAFLPTSGAPNYEKASDGNFYVVLKMRGIKQ